MKDFYLFERKGILRRRLLFLLLVFILVFFLNPYSPDFMEGVITSSFPSTVHLITYEEESQNFDYPSMICDSRDNVYVTWGVDLRDDNYGNSDEIRLQKFSSNGTSLGPRILLVNRSEISNATIALSHITLQIDSSDDFHLFWYVLEYTSPQIGHVYYKKFDSNLSPCTEALLIVSYEHYGWGGSAFHEMISQVVVDDYDFLHLLCCLKYYIYLDNNGTVIDQFRFTGSSIRSPSMVIDNSDNIFIVWELSDSTRIDFRALTIENDTIISVATRTLASGSYVLNPIILMGEEGLFVSWCFAPDFENSSTIYRQLDYLGETISTASCGFNNPGVNILSKNKSLVYTIHPVGNPCLEDDLKVYFSLKFFKGDIVIRKKLILMILHNPEEFHGPYIHSLSGIDNETGCLWLVWHLDDFTVGPMIQLWKLDTTASSVFPIIVVTPKSLSGEYEGALYNFSNPILTSAATTLREPTQNSTVHTTADSLPTHSRESTSKTLISETSVLSTQAWDILFLFSSILSLMLFRRIKVK